MHSEVQTFEGEHIRCLKEATTSTCQVIANAPASTPIYGQPKRFHYIIAMLTHKRLCEIFHINNTEC